ncbi:MAG TPA: hypothetical protein VHO06_21995 [Polyangia bacterium]|nr:hypothetical protein [Polyangia bacterium]
MVLGTAEQLGEGREKDVALSIEVRGVQLAAPEVKARKRFS